MQTECAKAFIEILDENVSSQCLSDTWHAIKVLSLINIYLLLTMTVIPFLF